MKGRRAVESVVETCCEYRRRFRAQPTGQMMAALPKSRITLPLRAFPRVGVDYGGPNKGVARAELSDIYEINGLNLGES